MRRSLELLKCQMAGTECYSRQGSDDVEELAGVFPDLFAEVVGGQVEQLGGCVCRMDQECGFVLLSTVWGGCEIRSIGFQHEPLDALFHEGVPYCRCVSIGDDPCE